MGTVSYRRESNKSRVDMEHTHSPHSYTRNLVEHKTNKQNLQLKQTFYFMLAVTSVAYARLPHVAGIVSPQGSASLASSCFLLSSPQNGSKNLPEHTERFLGDCGNLAGGEYRS